MTDCIWELQKAVFAALDGDGTLSALITGVYSHVPQDTAFPYIKFGDIAARNWSTNTSSGDEIKFNVEIFGRSRGAKEILEILKEVRRILDDASLAMTGCTMVSMKYNSADITQMPDGLTWHGIVSFDALIEEA